MSAMVELNGKAGRVCPQAQSGQMRCPCIVRTESEDVLTGEVFGGLRHIRPHLWLNLLLNMALGTETHRQVWFKNFQIRLWERQPRFPPELLKFKEGRTEPDIIIEWDNPATTIFIEAKYTSPLAGRTTHSETNDQVLRGIRTLLAATGHVQSDRLFHASKRRPVWLALLSYKPEAMVDHYRDSRILKKHVEGMVNVDQLPPDPFVGTLTWQDIGQALLAHRNQMTPTERSIALELNKYIEHKMILPKQVGLPVLPGPTDQTLSPQPVTLAS